MKRFGLKVLMLVAVPLLLSAVCAAQDKPQAQAEPKEAPARIDVTPEVQQSFKLLQARIAAAEAELKAARLEQENLLLRAALVFNVPTEYSPRIGEDGRLYFEKPQTRAASAQPSPASQPQQKPNR